MTTPPNSDTPRTDDEQEWLHNAALDDDQRYVVPADFAKKLERELRTASDQLAAAREELTAIKNGQKAFTTNDCLADYLGDKPVDFRASAIEECNKVAEALSGEPEIAQLKADLAKLREENAALRADRERLDWLEARGYVAAHHDRHFEGRTANFGWSRERTDYTLRAAIDAARAAQEDKR